MTIGVIRLLGADFGETALVGSTTSRSPTCSAPA